MLQYKIPQNVQVEDKITSFLTMRQLIICAIGGGFAYLFYITLAPKYYAEVWVPPVAFILALTIAVAFVKINDIRFTKWFLLLMEFTILPRRRVWDKNCTSDLFFSFVTSKRVGSQKKKKDKDAPKEKDLSALDKISSQLDQSPLRSLDKKGHAEEEKKQEQRIQKAAEAKQEAENPPSNLIHIEHERQDS